MGAFRRAIALDHGVEAVVTARRDRFILYEISVAFRGRGGATRPLALEAYSFVDDLHLFAKDLTRSGRPQLLLTATHGRVCSYVLDRDGDRLKPLYRREAGRVIVRPVRVRGGYDLVERFTSRQWEDFDDLGECVYEEGGMVRRVVHWDGKGFVPYRPGPSRLANPSAVPPDSPLQRFLKASRR